MQFCMRALLRVVLTSIALVLAMFEVPPVHGQAGTVTGTVVYNKTGLPLADPQHHVEEADAPILQVSSDLGNAHCVLSGEDSRCLAAR